MRKELFNIQFDIIKLEGIYVDYIDYKNLKRRDCC